MRRLLKFWLLLACLLGAQLLASAHGVEHLRGDADAAATHACVTCLAAQGMDAGLPSPPAVPLSAIAVQRALPSLPSLLLVVVETHLQPSRGPPRD